ncbi:MAG: response regulator [Anaerolineales bacterium]|nr:response regulator [Anaerolineales bacterium]MCX7755605.1 response regulator [Anaerolineales bacterium]MDW8277603.1 response regulator [Anaerolineales bacterium]
MALKILSIDDDPSITKLIRILLGIYGMEVLTANTGREGLALVRSESPDLVLLDIMMPEMNGWEVCQAIRSFSDVPIIAFSALGSPQEVEKALRMGFNDFLEKPSSAEILVERIQKLTTKKPDFPPPA